MLRSSVLSAALVGGMVLAGAPRVHAGGPANAGQGNSQGLTPAQRQQVKFVELLLLKQSLLIGQEERTIKRQDRAVAKLDNLELMVATNPKQAPRLDRLIQQTANQITAYQTRIDQSNTLLTAGQTVLNNAVTTLTGSLQNKPGGAGILQQIDRSVTRESQRLQAILNRPPATPSLPG
jgi:hypothetical protein